MTEPTRTPRKGLANAIRFVAALAVIGSSVAVTALTVDRNETVAVVVPQAHSAAVPAQPAPDPAAPAAPAAPAPATPAAPAPGASVPIGTGNSAPATSVPLGGGGAAPSAVVPGISPSVPLNPAAPGTGSPFETTTVDTQPACPLGWPKPERQGGLASLIGLAPLAGPFSSEAFALGSVYQPLLRLAGPILAEISPVIAQYQPLIDPIIKNVQGVEAVVLEAILPYYGPYRGQLIAAEGEVAKVLAPILDRVYNSEAAACLVAWQDQVIDAAQGGRITVASLARPGTVVELGPVEG
ncbi:hypothetical protein [Antrihabitans sp. YC2-6]|uniref:hypothetical protein n=1 Tax=Antrihabitans sp. YC2-6 TaxID=2799498 RepID=UPI0018F5FC6E|nr:hypothetical protein [Antrihabitans sp. YC2-6]MBJ8348178.1 hypothetical protein [Antrihabitans sp. YC2-6]